MGMQIGYVVREKDETKIEKAVASRETNFSQSEKGKKVVMVKSHLVLIRGVS